MWRKKSEWNDENSNVRELARELGVERRRNVRVLYPKLTTGPLPAITLGAQALQAHDLSVGGCCIQDPHEHLGKDVGNTLVLTLHFPDSPVEVTSRLVGRVDHRRHIQFLDLPPARAAQLAHVITSGVGAAYLKCTTRSEGQGAVLAAREIWSSLASDSLTITDDLHKAAQAVIDGRSILIHKNAWPTSADGERISREDMLGLILFVANIPRPSPAVLGLLESLEQLTLEAAA